ncbi:MAG: peptidylprolyl isomerase [Euryarchaeota archaeon]|nr:peptidylprolyl isomerase [Euryarchaeota archaeon]
MTMLLMMSTILISGCTGNEIGEGRAVKSGDTVQVDYTGKLENGTVFDTSIEEVAKKAGIYDARREYIPLNFTVGSGQVIEGFDEGLIGMKEGEEKKLTIPPEKAYGEYNESWVQAVPLENLNMSEKPEVGQVYIIYGGYFKVIAVNETHVTFDPNPGLAGKTLVFDIKLVSIR